MSARDAIVLAGFTAACLCARSALADGAFPDSLGILLPPDQPHRIVASTNFGLLVSDDDGASFGWVCEDVIGMLASIYQLGPGPDDRLYAVTVDGLSMSSDGACTWSIAQNLSTHVSDVFADPSDPARVLAIAQADTEDGGGVIHGVYESHDGGQSFSAKPLFLGPESSGTTGIEVARTDPQKVYVAMYVYAPPPTRSFLVVSSDSGRSWQSHDLSPSIGAMFPRILAVDPNDASRVYLRIFDNGPAEKLAVYDDTSGELRSQMQFDARMSAFLRRSDGALIIGTVEAGAFISTDGGATFATWPHAPHLRALGERAGVLYAVADNTRDGYAVGVSHDEGASWQPILRFDQITGPLACGDIPTRCAIPWQNLQVTLAMGMQPDTLPGFDDGGGKPTPDAGRGLRAHGGGCKCSLEERDEAASGARSRVSLAALALASLRGRRAKRAARNCGTTQPTKSPNR